MTCPQCTSHPETPTAFCTACGRDLRAGQATDDPPPVYAGTAEPAVSPGLTTEPVPSVTGVAPSGSALVHPIAFRRGHRPTPVKEMVGSERSEWIDSVWGTAGNVQR